MSTPSIFVNVLCTPQENWMWDTILFSAGQMFGGFQSSTGSVNAYASFDFYAEAGTYSIDLFHSTSTSRGIYAIEIDGVSVGNVDGYLGSGGAATRSTVTGITIGSTGTHRVTLTMATKNASASTYTGAISGIYFTKTA